MMSFISLYSFIVLLGTLFPDTELQVPDIDLEPAGDLQPQPEGAWRPTACRLITKFYIEEYAVKLTYAL